MANPLRVLFLCTGNSARSQMAEGLLRSFTTGRADSHSAGTLPKDRIHPLAITTMRDRFNLDISDQFPKTIDAYLGQKWDYVITVCDRAAESCPVFPGDAQRIHWSFPDPAAETETDAQQQRAFEAVANDIAARLRLWLALPDVSRRIAD